MGKKLLLGLVGAGALAAATVFHKKEKIAKAKKDTEKHPKDNTEIEKIKPITNNEEGS